MDNKEKLTGFPESLRSRRQWVLWRYETRGGKSTKVPYQPDGRHAAVRRPEEWSAFEDCLAVADGFDGLGFVFTEGLVGIDLDKCFDYDGTLKPFARDVLQGFDTYTEISPSGNGLHLILESDFSILGRRKDGIECYSVGRFFTVTGNVYEGRDTLHDCDIGVWHNEVFGERKTDNQPPPVTGGYLPDDDRILSVMFRSKNGRKIQALYSSGDWAAAGYGSQSEADLALVGLLMFFCRNDMATVDRLFRASKLMRDKWDEKRGSETYGQRTMREAIKAEVMAWEGPPKLDFVLSGGKNPVPLLILENVCLALENDRHSLEAYRLNDFSHMIEVRRGSAWENLQDNDVLDAERYISREWPYFAKIGKDMTVDALRQIASLTRVNPPVDYLRRLRWDEVPRLDYWLHMAFGTPNDELHAKMGANWIKGLVSRVLHPGCQFDQVLVLEGPQGWRKSTALRVLGAPWHVESTLSTDDRDFYMLLASNVIVEFSEGEIVGRTSARRLKAIITKTEDRYRAPYERGIQAFRRGCVFAMTTNDNDYQKDETGGRRWLPVVLGKMADTNWLKENRDMLFAEAVYRVEDMKETTYEYPQDELNELQREKMEYDEIAEAVQDWFEGLPKERKEEGVLTIEAYNGALNKELDEKEIPQPMMWRISRIFKTVLGLKNKPLRREGKLRKRWFPNHL